MSTTYRVYPHDPSSSIYQHYYLKNTHHTLKFNQEIRAKYQNRDRFPMMMKQALLQLDSFRDPSDPDTSGSNLIHAYQTAERIRQERPNDTWLQVVGLIHDGGKILYKKGEPDWAVVGDTFPLGCSFSSHCVYSQFFPRIPIMANMMKLVFIHRDVVLMH